MLDQNGSPAEMDRNDGGDPLHFQVMINKEKIRNLLTYDHKSSD